MQLNGYHCIVSGGLFINQFYDQSDKRKSFAEGSTKLILFFVFFGSTILSIYSMYVVIDAVQIFKNTDDDWTSFKQNDDAKEQLVKQNANAEKKDDQDQQIVTGINEGGYAETSYELQRYKEILVGSNVRTSLLH